MEKYSKEDKIMLFSAIDSYIVSCANVGRDLDGDDKVDWEEYETRLKNLRKKLEDDIDPIERKHNTGVSI